MTDTKTTDRALARRLVAIQVASVRDLVAVAEAAARLMSAYGAWLGAGCPVGPDATALEYQSAWAGLDAALAALGGAP